MGKVTFEELKTHLFTAADILRKHLNASENSKPVLALLFLKRLNDVFEELIGRIVFMLMKKDTLKIQTFS